jgi:hypothetical protein
MKETVHSIYDSLPERDNISVLNVGFGLGIVSGPTAISYLIDTIIRLIDCSKPYRHPLPNMLSLSPIRMYCGI